MRRALIKTSYVSHLDILFEIISTFPSDSNRSRPVDLTEVVELQGIAKCYLGEMVLCVAANVLLQLVEPRELRTCTVCTCTHITEY